MKEEQEAGNEGMNKDQHEVMVFFRNRNGITSWFVWGDSLRPEIGIETPVRSATTLLSLDMWTLP